jgi:hypothetical protein
MAVAAVLMASCSSNSAPAPSTTTAPSAPPTTATPALSTIAGQPAPGTTQSATGPSGQKVSGTPTTAEHIGAEVGGPAGSWLVGLVVVNQGPGAFQSIPASQVTVVDSSGKSHAPLVMSTPETGMPTSLAVGGQLRMVLVYVLPAGVTPRTVTFAPFASPVPALQWAA